MHDQCCMWNHRAALTWERRSADRRAVGDVDTHAGGGHAEFLRQRGSGRTRSVDVEVAHRDRPSVGGKGSGDRGTDAAGCTGDDDYS